MSLPAPEPAGTIAPCCGLTAMARDRRNRAVKLRRLAAAVLLLMTPLAEGGDFVAALQQRYAVDQDRLRDSPFHRPLYLESTEVQGALEGTVHARVERPFNEVRQALGDASHWCELLLLMPNIADCRVQDGGTRLVVGLVRRVDTGAEAAMPLELSFTREAQSDGLKVDLQARRGPVGTRDYRIGIAAIPVAPGQTFLRLRYAYRYGVTARLLAKAYLAGPGGDKAGFSRAGVDERGAPRYVDGLRGAVERNALRCYLAIDAHVVTLAAPAPARFEVSLRHWMAAIRPYPQLQEEDIDRYVSAKRRAYRHWHDHG